MADFYLSEFIVVGNTNQLISLHDVMKELENTEDSLVENGFGNRWLGNLVIKLGGDWEKIYCRGSWENLGIEKDFSKLYFDFDIAHGSVSEMIQFINSIYPDIKLYYQTLDQDILETNDTQGIYFPQRYCFGINGWWDYYSTVEELKEHIERYIDCIVPSNTFKDCKLSVENYIKEISGKEPDIDGINFDEKSNTEILCYEVTIIDTYKERKVDSPDSNKVEEPLYTLF